MWVCLNDAFLSIVQKDCAPDELLVRARRRGDIKKIFPEAKVVRTPKGDYHFRAVVKRNAAIEAMAGEVRRINYDNFKDSVDTTTPGGRKLHDAYLRVWATMEGLQPRPKRASLFDSSVDYFDGLGGRP